MFPVRLSWNYVRIITYNPNWQQALGGERRRSSVYLRMEPGENSGLDFEDAVFRRALAAFESLILQIEPRAPAIVDFIRDDCLSDNFARAESTSSSRCKKPSAR